MNTPINITKQQIYNKMLELAKSYVPEWNTEGDVDVGMVLYQIFAEQMENTISLYHTIPQRNFIYFLNILGADTLGSMPAEGYATIHMNEGNYHSVPIKKGTRLFCEKENDERIIYETKNDFLAIHNSIEAIYCTTSDKSCIVCSYDKEEQKNEIVLFDFDKQRNLQQYCMVLGSETIFDVNENDSIILHLLHNEKKYMAQKVAEFLGNNTMVIWEVLTEQGWQSIKSIKTVDTTVVLKIECKIPILEQKEMKQRNRFLKCTFLQKSDIPITITEMKIDCDCNDLKPIYLYCNDFLLPEKQALPFSEQYHIYDAFYIGCQKAFSKKNAMITIDILISHNQYDYDEVVFQKNIIWKSILDKKAVQSPAKVPITIEEVVWEYWNGIGWKSLFLNKEYSDFFSGEQQKSEKIVFRCPEDIQEYVVGAEKGYYIRARIVRISNTFAQHKYYNAPVLQQINISCHGFSVLPTPDIFYIKKDMETLFINQTEQKEIILLPEKRYDSPICYIALSQKMEGGNIQMYFQNARADRQNMPAIKWEYFGEQNGIQKWIPLQVMDETKFFAQSGLLTYRIPFTMEQKEIFQKKYYWLRAVNTDKKYEYQNEQKPCFSDICFNTVKIIQQETMEEMYFYIAPNQQNKKCKLLYGNVTNIEVFVKEQQHWEKWQQTNHFHLCDEQSKVYILHKKEGEVIFGDGKNGKIPPYDDTATIRIKYAVCKGKMGNCKKGELNDFADSIPFVDKVVNYQTISGGCDIEQAEKAMKRCKNILKTQHHAVSAEDYTILCKEADRNVVQVKILQHEKSNSQTAFTLAVLPQQNENGKSSFYEIRRHIKQMLLKKAPVVIANRIDVIQVKYIAYCIKVELTINHYEYYQSVYDTVKQKLLEYIHPITGNFDRKGFTIGQLPTQIKIHHLIKTVEYISGINTLYINYYDCDNEHWQEISWEEAQKCEYAVPISGTHEIYIDVRV